MEHATDNSDYVGFWIQRISNMENNEEDNGPYFRYNLLMRSENGNMQVRTHLVSYSVKILTVVIKHVKHIILFLC